MGRIPDDAISCGGEARNQTYIGQGLLKDVGLIPGMIYSGESHMMVPYGGSNHIDRQIKVGTGMG